MRKYLASLAMLGCTPPGVAAATSIDETSQPSVTILRVDGTDEPASFSRLLDGLLVDGKRTVVTGDANILKRLRPSYAYVWPATDTIVLDPAAGLGIFGFDAKDDATRTKVLSLWPWEPDAFSADASGRSRRAAPPAVTRHVRFDVLATSPAGVCQGFAREMARSMFGDATPSTEQRTAFRAEVRRWCQHGHLSVRLAEQAEFTVDSFASSEHARLTLASEWALIRSEDIASGTRYFFWNKTLGDGAGNGFTLGRDNEGHTDGAGGVDGIMDVAIHSGWGSVMPGDDTYTWPVSSTFPLLGNVRAFRCDGPEEILPSDCPAGPVVRRLYPTDSVDGSVNRASGESFSFGGEAALGGAVAQTGGTASATFALAVAKTSATVAHSDMTLTNVRSNADRVYSRSTWWRPDVPAMIDWIRARQHAGSLAKATPLAATIHPRYEILWELPAEGNAGRVLPYHVFYEMGINTCTWGCVCRLQGKPRVGWSDYVLVRVPEE